MFYIEVQEEKESIMKHIYIDYIYWSTRRKRKHHETHIYRLCQNVCQS